MAALHDRLFRDNRRLMYSIDFNGISFFLDGADARMAGGYRSAWQEYALIVSLEMFNIMLDKCNMLLKEQMDSSQGSLSSGRLLGEDLQIILPAIKVSSSIGLLFGNG